MSPKSAARSPSAHTGVGGLDEVLGDGFPRNRLYLVDGEPGTGKTTLALQFLLDGERMGEPGLYVTLSETAEELRAAARSHGWDLGGIEVLQLEPHTADASEDAYTIFHPAEIELSETVAGVLTEVDRLRPTRVVFDSLSELRLLARDPLRFRRQILALKQFFTGRDCTVLLLDDRSAPEGDMQLHSIAHGVLQLEHIAIDYGAERRRLQVKKLRGAQFRGGYHDFRIATGGLTVYPRIEHQAAIEPRDAELLPSGSPALDTLLGGGLVRGTSTLVMGPAGTGKSVLATQYALAAAARGERVQFFLFDERISTFYQRARGLGIDVERAAASGQLVLQQIEPTEMSPGEFANLVACTVKEKGTRLVVIDSINGYMQSMPAERLLPVQVHELLTFLSNHGVSALMTLVQHGVFGAPVDEAAEVSYLADTVVLLRYFEYLGAVRQAISVVKKRSGPHERTIRECRIGPGGMAVGEPLEEFQGVLTGVPQYQGTLAPLGNGSSPAADDARPAAAT